MATKAYFSASANSPNNIFTSGTLEVNVDEVNSMTVSNMRPGDSNLIEFDVQNTGTLPIQVKGFLAGEWGDQTLDSNVFEILSIQRATQEGWQLLSSQSLAVGEEFFLSNDLSENNLSLLQPGEQASLRVLLKLSDSTSDSYQNQTFSTSLHVAAKQAVEASSWPTNY